MGSSFTGNNALETVKSGGEAASCLFEGETGVRIPRRTNVFRGEIGNEWRHFRRDGVEGGSGDARCWRTASTRAETSGRRLEKLKFPAVEK